MKQFLILVALVSSILISCRKDPEIILGVKFTNFTLRDISDFDMEDSVVIVGLKADTFLFKINIEPKQYSDKVFYYINNDDSNKITNEWLTIDSTINSIECTIELDNNIKTGSITVLVDFFGNGHLDSITIKPSATENISSIYLNNKSRGLLSIFLYNRWGDLLFESIEYKISNEFCKQIDLSDFDRGTYFLLVQLGNEIKAMAITKL